MVQEVEVVEGGTVVISTGTPSRSRCITETINGSHHFTINGYSLAKGTGIGKYITSDTFTVGGYKWAIYFYPDGKNAEDNSLYISVFIALASEGTDVRALFELTLLDQSGKSKHKIHSHFDRSLEGGPYTLKYKGSMWGYKRFYRREALETSDFLKNDTLELSCTVGVVVSWTQGSRIYTIHPPEQDIGKHVGALLDVDDPELASDVTFEVDGETFKAHKIVLAARSPVFKAQLMGPMRERNTDLFKIQDMKAPVFKAMLHFMYRDVMEEEEKEEKDEVEEEEEEVGEGEEDGVSTTLMSQHLLAAADRYGLDRLRVLCELKLCENIGVDTVATTLALAELHHASHLKSVCLKFTAENLAAVMQCEGFDYLRESCPSLLSELLKTLAGGGGGGGGGGGYSSGSSTEKAINRNCSVWGQMSDGADANGRRVRQKT